jgi:hypothetical protein
MPLPAGVTTATATWGPWGELSGDDGTAVVTVRPFFGAATQHIIWAATGKTMLDTTWTVTATSPGDQITLELPHVDQAGWVDPAGNAFSMWTYMIEGAVTIGAETRTLYRNVQPVEGQDNFDLDATPYAAVGAPSSAAVPAVTSVNGQTGAVVIEGGEGGATNLSATRDGTTVTVVSDTGTDAVLAAADGSNAGVMTTAMQTKLAGVASAATANATDAQLRDRATHTGFQAISTVTDLQTELNGKEATLAVPDQAEAEAGTETTARKWTSQRVRQAAAAAIAAILPNTATGRAVLNAADAAAGRTALGITPTPVRFSAETASTGTTGSDRAAADRTITEARMRVGGAPAGSALTAEVQHYNGSAWSTVATLSIAAGSTTEDVETGLSQAQSAGHLLRLNVTSVGSTTAATDVVVDVITT